MSPNRCHSASNGLDFTKYTFDQFGDSALNLVLRCYLPNLDNRLPVIHDLHTAIHRTFKEAGIEIAFPQRDIH
ncbi:MAG: mechanosensitive ion channel, partial [Thermoleophilia bacterium]|nr:mechanosensitive ion channel [Thermoleophilia bacterium]